MPSLEINWGKQNVRLVLVVLFEHTILKLVEFDKVSEVADKADPPDFSFILLELKFISDSWNTGICRLTTNGDDLLFYLVHRVPKYKAKTLYHSWSTDLQKVNSLR